MNAFVPPRYPFEHLIKIRRHGPEFFADLAREYGDLVRLQAGKYPLLLISHPDDVAEVLTLPATAITKGRAVERARRILGDGLLGSQGDFHRRQRRLMQPAFHRQRLAGYAEAMIDEARRMAERWDRSPYLDVHHQMMDLTLSVVCRTLLGRMRPGDTERVRHSVEACIDAIGLADPPWQELADRLPFSPGARMDAARRVLDDVVYRMIAEHRQAGEDQGNLLSMLLMAQDEGQQMTDLQVRDEAMTIFMAGHETTANALTWTWYLLAGHPDVEARLHAEIEQALAGQLPTPDDVSRLPYTRQVLTEAMRLYPPAWVIARRALHDIDLRRASVPQGTLMVVSPWVIQHDARWYSNPYRFDPSRWTPEFEASRPRMAYFPFGAGTRMCIGEHFAWTEGILVLATLAQRWKLSRIGTAPIRTLARITLRPRRPVLMRLHPRG